MNGSLNMMDAGICTLSLVLNRRTTNILENSSINLHHKVTNNFSAKSKSGGNKQV